MTIARHAASRRPAIEHRAVRSSMRALRSRGRFSRGPREFEPHAGPELRGGDHVASLAGESQGKLTPSTMWVLRDQALCRICGAKLRFSAVSSAGEPAVDLFVDSRTIRWGCPG